VREQIQLKPISKEAISRAVQKAERYRLINQSWAAESICRDILGIDPTNQQVLVMLVLALTDQLAEGHATVMKEVKEVLPRITDQYQRFYYTGITSERSGQAYLHRGGMGSGAMAYDALRLAMSWYEKAEQIRPAGNDDAILRWNTCARLINTHSHLAPHAESAYEPALED
jgi:predicted GIY-YIG superfamily endonuclease